MPKHDIPDGDEADTNLIDFRDYLHRRADRTAQEKSGPEPADREIYRHAEYADGKRPRLGRHDLIWVAIILVLGWIVWVAVA